MANFSLATDEGFRSRETGEWIDRAEWHRIVTFQPGLVEALAKHCRKGRRAFVQGKLQTRKWKDGEGRDRTTTEVLIVPGGRVSVLDKANGSDSAGADPSGARSLRRGHPAAGRRARERRRRPPLLPPSGACVPLGFAPGEAYQLDWSHDDAVLSGVTTRVKAAHMRLCHSRMYLVQVFPREGREMAFEAHERTLPRMSDLPLPPTRVRSMACPARGRRG